MIFISFKFWSLLTLVLSILACNCMLLIYDHNFHHFDNYRLLYSSDHSFHTGILYCTVFLEKVNHSELVMKALIIKLFFLVYWLYQNKSYFITVPSWCASAVSRKRITLCSIETWTLIPTIIAPFTRWTSWKKIKVIVAHHT